MCLGGRKSVMTRMDGGLPGGFLRATGFWDDSCIGEAECPWRVAVCRCALCGLDTEDLYLTYPHLDPGTVLEERELALLRAKKGRVPPEPGEFERCVARLSDAFGVRVCSGTSFGRTRVKVTKKAKHDFEVLPLTRDFFMTRRAAEALWGEGWEFDALPADATGKHAAVADLMQVVVPIVGVASLPPGGSICRGCGRTVGPEAPSGFAPGVVFKPGLDSFPFFRMENRPMMVVREGFVTACRALGLKGLMDGATVKPLVVVEDPNPGVALRAWPWSRAVVAPETGQAKGLAPAVAVRVAEVACLDGEGAAKWSRDLEAFLAGIRARGGKTTWKTGKAKSGAGKGTGLAKELKALLDACGGRLEFSWALDVDGEERGGEWKLDAGTLAELAKECRAWVKESWLAEDEEAGPIWAQATPFLAMGDGNFLALRGGEGKEPRVVIHLDHEDASTVLSPSLGEFLKFWRAVGYGTPDLSEWSDCFSSVTGWLDAGTPGARRLGESLKAR